MEVIFLLLCILPEILGMHTASKVEQNGHYSYLTEGHLVPFCIYVFVTIWSYQFGIFIKMIGKQYPAQGGYKRVCHLPNLCGTIAAHYY